MSHQVTIKTTIDNLDDFEAMMLEYFKLPCTRDVDGVGYYKTDVIKYATRLDFTTEEFRTKRTIGLVLSDTGTYALKLDGMDYGRCREALANRAEHEAIKTLFESGSVDSPAAVSMCFQAWRAAEFHASRGRSLDLSFVPESKSLQLVATDF